MTAHVCIQSGCPVIIEGPGMRRCLEHTREYDRRMKARSPASRKVYASKRWAGLRRTVLAEQPWCDCGIDCCPEGCTRMSEDVDHIIPVEDGGAPFDRSNVHGLAHSCHGRKTAQEVLHR